MVPRGERDETIRENGWEGRWRERTVDSGEKEETNDEEGGGKVPRTHELPNVERNT